MSTENVLPDLSKIDLSDKPTPEPANTARTKSTIYRVTGLPIGQQNKTISLLKEALSEHASKSELERLGDISVVPSCDDEQTSVALLEWKGDTPNFLSSLDKDLLGSWEIEVGDDDISFDRHFFGFTQMYSTSPEKSISADIIAVSGLDGHAYGSFRGRGSLRRMWLRNFLSKDLPNCRTMIYGYNSKLSSRGINRIMDYGRGFLDALKRIRRSKEASQRPLFFICHSFGGIIIAHSIIQAAMMTDEGDGAISSVYKSTYGILFFGTPHKGLVIADIQKMIVEDGDNPRSVLLNEIDKQSSILLSQLSDFTSVIKDRKIISFYEQSQTKSLVKNERAEKGHAWGRSGNFVTAVEVESAVLGLPPSMEIKVPLDLDHSNMIKFESKREEGYRSAVYHLSNFEKDASSVVAGRFSHRQILIKPSSTVPFARDMDFVGRRDIMKEIDAKFESQALHARVALVGLGGMGLRDMAPSNWVFWVYASSQQRFELSYRNIANALELPGRDDPKIDILRLVLNWLTNERNGRWLLILDNADDAKMFASQPADEGEENLLTYIPQTVTGSVLVTSRNKDSAVRLVGAERNIFPIGKMEINEALSLIERKLASGQLVALHQLLDALDNIPLAITQAAAYISKLAPRMTPSKYLDLFNQDQSSLLDKDSGDLRRDPEISNSIITTWQISFNQIQKDNPSAAELLSLMSVLNRQGIPESLLLKESDNNLSFEAALAPLLEFSLVLYTKDLLGDCFEMHKLVQLATRMWLKVTHDIQNWEQKALKLLSKGFPDGSYENLELCEQLHPHVEEVLCYSFEGKLNELHKSNILYKQSNYLSTKGNYRLSEFKIEQALAIKQLYLDRTDQSLVDTYDGYGKSLILSGKNNEAETIHRQTLQLNMEVLGQRHPNTLISMNNLAMLFCKRGKNDEAETMLRNTLELMEERLDPQHPSTLTIMNNLAHVLSSQGKYSEAEAINRKALELMEDVLGQRHPRTLTSMNNLALVLNSQGKYSEAEAINRKTLELMEEVLGQQHPDTLTSMNNLALVSSSQGKYSEAEAIHRKTLELMEEVLGQRHPGTLTNMNNLALVLNSQGKYSEAEAIHRKTFELREELFGQRYPDTLTSMNNLAHVLSSQGKYSEAETIHRKTLDLMEEVLGQQHPRTLTSMSNLTSVLYNQKKYVEASILYERAYLGYKEVLGPDHPYTNKFQGDYASLLEEMDGKNNEANKAESVS